jgi:hypothetical protein
VAVIDGFDDLAAVLYFGVFLHHFSEEIVLHLSDDASLLYDLEIGFEFIFLAQILLFVCLPLLFDVFPPILFHLVEILYFGLDVEFVKVTIL